MGLIETMSAGPASAMGTPKADSSASASAEKSTQ